MSQALAFSDVLKQFDVLLAGIVHTVWLSVAAMALGVLIGIIGAMVKSGRHRLLRWMAGIYVEAIRNTPFLVQLFMVYFGLPGVGIHISATAAALIALTINLGAYSTEIIRAGIEATHPSQVEAGAALGLRRRDILIHVVLLPSIERVWPALASQFILTMLATSIVSQISVEELTSAAAVIDSQTYRSMEVYIVAAGLYLVLTLLFRVAFELIGRALFPRRRLMGASR